MDQSSKTALGILLVILLVPSAEASAEGAGDDPGGKGARLPISNTVGLRLTVSNVDVALRSADLDLAMYTRGYGPTTGGGAFATAGSPFLGYPALEYGDGNSVFTTLLALTATGGGPGGSNVYRNVASFSHTYPGPGTFTARAAMVCAFCTQSSYAVFPAGSPPPTAFTGAIDFRPASVVGQLPLRLTYAGTIPLNPSNSLRYAVVDYPVVTHTAQVVLDPLAIPTVSLWGLVSLGVALLAAGLVAMRRTAGRAPSDI